MMIIWRLWRSEDDDLETITQNKIMDLSAFKNLLKKDLLNQIIVS